LADKKLAHLQKTEIVKKNVRLLGNYHLRETFSKGLGVGNNSEIM
jgi:hypothetical protein